MQVIYESQRVAERARKRILLLAEKGEFSTDEPIMVEIALAQVDATLAVAQAVMEVRDEIAESRGAGNSKEAKLRRERLNENLRHHLDYTDTRVDELVKRLTKVESGLPMLVHQLANTDTKAERQEVSRLWWEFWKKE